MSRKFTSVLPAVGCSMRLSNAITLFCRAALPAKERRTVNHVF